MRVVIITNTLYNPRKVLSIRYKTWSDSLWQRALLPFPQTQFHFHLEDNGVSQTGDANTDIQTIVGTYLSKDVVLLILTRARWFTSLAIASIDENPSTDMVRSSILFGPISVRISPSVFLVSKRSEFCHVAKPISGLLLRLYHTSNSIKPCHWLYDHVKYRALNYCLVLISIIRDMSLFNKTLYFKNSINYYICLTHTKPSTHITSCDWTQPQSTSNDWTQMHSLTCGWTQLSSHKNICTRAPKTPSPIHWQCL